MSEKNQNKKVVFSVRRAAEKLNNKYEKSLTVNDPVFTEPIHKTEEPQKEKLMLRTGVDIYFMIIVLAISLLGAVMAYSASSYYADHFMGDSMFYFKRHVIFLVASVLFTSVFVIFARPWFWRMFGIGIYIVSVILLIAVLFIGSEGGGAQRWIEIGPITIQPSELGKMATVMLLAHKKKKYEKNIELNQRFNGHFKYGVLYPGLAIGCICVLVMLEKHLSGIIIIGLLGLTIMFIGGTDRKWLGIIVGVGIVAVLAVLFFSDYAQERVNTWLHLEDADPSGPAWQTWQGLYAIGSGGLFGVGLGNSRQKYGFVSQPQNDFIFTIVCEELGLFGALIVITLFILLLWRGYKIASKAPDKFCSLVVYGLTTKVALQTLLNIAVVTNSMPNTGISLPFFSSGGTALMLQIFEMGIILNISKFSYIKK